MIEVPQESFHLFGRATGESIAAVECLYCVQEVSKRPSCELLNEQILPMISLNYKVSRSLALALTLKRCS